MVLKTLVTRGKYFRLIGVIVLLAACSKGTVDLSLDGEYAKIKNDLGSRIFYNIGEREFLDNGYGSGWMPTSKSPVVEDENSKMIHFDGIQNGDTSGVGRGDWIKMYWWDDDYRDAEDLHAEEIMVPWD